MQNCIYQSNNKIFHCDKNFSIVLLFEVKIFSSNNCHRISIIFFNIFPYLLKLSLIQNLHLYQIIFLIHIFTEFSYIKIQKTTFIERLQFPNYQTGLPKKRTFLPFVILNGLALKEFCLQLSFLS